MRKWDGGVIYHTSIFALTVVSSPLATAVVTLVEIGCRLTQGGTSFYYYFEIVP